MDLETAFRNQAEACGRLGSPMYAELLSRAADDVVDGGPTAAVLAGYEDEPGPSALALRLAGSVHRLVLERRAGAVAAYYPSVGGTWADEPGWAAVRELLADQPDAVREWLDRPPQTNEVGRSAALLGGLLELSAAWPGRPVRLLELGSSGGLNLLADRYRYRTRDGRDVGPRDSPVVVEDAWTGPVPTDAAWPRIVERTGSDVLPVDVATTEGRLTLTAYVWADQVHRHERLRGALAVAAQVPPQVRAQSAGDLVDAIDLEAGPDGALTVVWHSVMWQYLDRAEQDRVRSRLDALGAAASDDRPFAHLFLEPTRRSPDEDHEFWVVLESWPSGGAPVRRFLGRSRGHGVPCDWERAGAGDPAPA
ncbi:DUF2332 family protein [Nocardioides dongxiaopingii]|uniref:DUF2332 domain-containing protein n=1 Tax=Nocardioides sp. S-1144 TaxID=2582905 RepID=UPI00110E1F4E|nr:DUF2332 domain-containing protein [Nocardioides sp. S-1144]QCW50290.1 DUF2332 family protein [Nocardioides sp. S-1144]